MDPNICIQIKEVSLEKALKKIKRAEKHANMVEVWLDHIKDLDLKTLLNRSNLPMLVVYQNASHGGRFKGTGKQRVDRLIEAMSHYIEYVEMPFRANSPSVKRLARAQKKYPTSKLVLSYRNAKRTPSIEFLLHKAEQMKKAGANLVKIVTQANHRNDTIKIIMLSKQLTQKKIDHAVWATGMLGKLSQLMTPTVGSQIVPACVTENEAEETHLLSIKQIRTGWECFEEIDT